MNRSRRAPLCLHAPLSRQLVTRPWALVLARETMARMLVRVICIIAVIGGDLRGSFELLNKSNED